MIARHIALVSAFLVAAGSALAADIKWDHQESDHLSLILDGQTLWTYHYAARDNVPYFHPVNVPGGPTLTNFAPKDHPWHRALWFCWKTINGVRGGLLARSW